MIKSGYMVKIWSNGLERSQLGTHERFRSNGLESNQMGPE